MPKKVSDWRVEFKNNPDDIVVCLSEEEWLAPMETRLELNLSMDLSIQNFRRRRGRDPMTGDHIPDFGKGWVGAIGQ